MWIKIDNYKLSNLIKVGSLTFENPEIISDVETPCSEQFRRQMETNLKNLTGYNIPVLLTEGMQSITFIKKDN